MNSHLGASTLYEKAVSDGLPYNGLAALNALLHSVPRELSTTEFRVVASTKLARALHGTRGAARDGLRLLVGTPYIEVRRVTGATATYYTFEARLLTDAEALLVVV